MTETNDIDMQAEAAKPPVTKPVKAKAKAKPKAKTNGKAPAKEPTAKQLQAAADKAAKAEEKAAAKAKADAEKAEAKKIADDKKLVTTTENKCKPLINAGLKAMHMVGNGNKGWTIAAFQIRAACKGTPVNFKDVMEKEWGVAKNTATKLANAGQLMYELTHSESEEVRNQLSHMPMGSINNLSVISGFSDVKLETGIDLEIIKMDSTEADISAFARDYNDKGKKIVVATVPAGEADEGEDEGAAPAAAPKSAPITAAAFLNDCATVALSSEEVQVAIISLLDAHDADTVIEVIEALETAHGIASE